MTTASRINGLVDYFYRQDGLKRVLIPKRLFMVAGFVFAVLTVGVVIQGTPDAIDGEQN